MKRMMTRWLGCSTPRPDGLGLLSSIHFQVCFGISSWTFSKQCIILNRPTMSLVHNRGLYAPGVSQELGMAMQRWHVSLDPYSDDCIALVQRWVETCNASHTMCQAKRRYSPRQLPKRVLDVGFRDDSNITLFEYDDSVSRPQAAYIALSHCWGKSWHLISTKDNLSHRKMNILWNELRLHFRMLCVSVDCLPFDIFGSIPFA